MITCRDDIYWSIIISGRWIQYYINWSTFPGEHIPTITSFFRMHPNIRIE